MGVLTDISFCWTIISIVCTAHNCWLINTTFFPLTNTTATSCADLQLCHKITFCCHDRWQKDGLTLLLLQSAPLAIMGQCLQSELQYETSVTHYSEEHFWKLFLPLPVTEKSRFTRAGCRCHWPGCGWQKNKQLGVTLGDPSESHSIITTVILHTKALTETVH